MTRNPANRVQLINELDYSFGSTDNGRTYETEVDLTDGCQPSTIYGVLVDDRHVIVIGDAGGASLVHHHSLLVLNSRVFIAIGAHIVCFTLGNTHLDWTLKADWATCFGVYYDRKHDSLTSHGELSICRFSSEGEIIWSEHGADIFSEGFALRPDHIEAIDFAHKVYCFDYLTGNTITQ